MHKLRGFAAQFRKHAFGRRWITVHLAVEWADGGCAHAIRGTVHEDVVYKTYVLLKNKTNKKERKQLGLQQNVLGS